MSKGHSTDKRGQENSHVKKIKEVPLSGRDRVKITEHRKIAPKHPNMGKR